MSETTATVAIRACGCCCLAMSNPAPDDSRAAERRKDIAKEVASAIREGLRIETWTNEQVCANPWGCDVCKPPAPGVQQDLFGGAR